MFLFWAINWPCFSFLSLQGKAAVHSRSTEELSTRTNWERITQHSHNTFTVHTTLTQRPHHTTKPLPSPNPFGLSATLSQGPTLCSPRTLPLTQLHSRTLPLLRCTLPLLHSAPSPSHSAPRLPLQSAPFHLSSPLYRTRVVLKVGSVITTSHQGFTIPVPCTMGHHGTASN